MSEVANQDAANAAERPAVVTDTAPMVSQATSGGTAGSTGSTNIQGTNGAHGTTNVLQDFLYDTPQAN